jgi:hypothetical protein
MSQPKRAVESWMPRWLRRALGGLRPAMLFALLGLLVACSDSGGPPGGASVRTGGEASVYFVTGAHGWPAAKPAYKPRPDDPTSSRAEPTLDWYAEHERFLDPSRSERVRLSGHHVSVGQLEEAMPGFLLRPRQVRGLQAKAGSGPDGPRIILLPVAPGYTVMTLTYELSLDELVEWTNALKAVDEAGWVAAGGVIPR